MGTIFSSTDNPPDSYNHDPPTPSDSQNPKSLPNSPKPDMSSTDEDDTQKTLQSKPQIPEEEKTQTPDSSIDTKIDKTIDEEIKTQEDIKTTNDNGEEIEGEGEREEEEEEDECGFCLFMKGGGCKESFVAWENCVEEAEKNKEDVVDKCFEATSTLRKCMDAHADYYEPILRAEKAAQDEVVKELEKEKEAEESDQQKKVESNENAAGN
ncbi:hypothetical protein Dsin_010007 [Dipteronia sinensis]|uniref:GCK domain-containing protein n=1 Tax=Dipteronia sinensis TaxID=43782 RepID=A0AAE0ECN1_9ROSI|nr:hypothetical protein Dsin_010007 [Dipteronia sinensis]